MYDDILKNTPETNSFKQNTQSEQTQNFSTLQDIVSFKSPFELYQYLETLPESVRADAVISLLISPDNANFSSLDADRILKSNSKNTVTSREKEKVSDFGSKLLRKKLEQDRKSYKEIVKKLSQKLEAVINNRSELTRLNTISILNTLANNRLLIKLLTRKITEENSSEFMILKLLTTMLSAKQSGLMVSFIHKILTSSSNLKTIQIEKVLTPLLMLYINKLADSATAEVIEESLSPELLEHPVVAESYKNLLKESDDISDQERAMREKLFDATGSGLTE